MAAKSIVIQGCICEPLNRRQVITDWKSVNWKGAHKTVQNLRQRIFRATKASDFKKVKQLQKLMLRSTSNYLTSVRRITQVNAGKNTPGVDKILVKTPEARAELIKELMEHQPWKAKPVKRVFIPKSNGKLRPLGIPTIKERCMQAIVKNALEPLWEAKFEGISYGFRPGRSCHDAIEKIYRLARPTGKKRWRLDADIKGAFDNINQGFLLNKIGKYQFPAIELIKQWLKAGVMEEGRYLDTNSGTPQGGVISPLLANIALHGMERALEVQYNHKGTIIGTRAVVRYADDFVVFCESKEEAEKAQRVLGRMLAKRGLEFSPEKTNITQVSEGFNFLGFNIRQYNTPSSSRSGKKLLITPSKDSVKKLRKRLKEEWMNLKTAPLGMVIKRLNSIVKGWGNYFRTGVSSKVFSDLDNYMFQRQRRFASRRHPNKSVGWKTQKYWGKIDGRNDKWVFMDKAATGETKPYLQKFAWIPIERHVMVVKDSSPDDPALKSYWENRRMKKKNLLVSKGMRQRLFNIQKEFVQSATSH